MLFDERDDEVAVPFDDPASIDSDMESYDFIQNESDFDAYIAILLENGMDSINTLKRILRTFYGTTFCHEVDNINKDILDKIAKVMMYLLFDGDRMRRALLEKSAELRGLNMDILLCNCEAMGNC